MSIQDEVARLILSEQEEGNVGVSDIAQALADAGLLAPELPRPNKVYESGAVSWWDGPETLPYGYVDIGEYGILAPEEAQHLAHQILAAAKYAEEGTNA